MCCGEEVIKFQRSYETAINSGSDTTQQYIAITVVNDNTGSVSSICIPAGSLLAALAVEHSIPIDDPKIRNLALSSSDHTFHFSKLEALKHLDVSYTSQELESFAGKLSGFTNQELEVGFGVQQRYDQERNIVRMHDLYRRYPSKQYQAYRDAIACILVNRNISPLINMCSGGLYVEVGE